MKVWAISDVHVGHKANREMLRSLPHHPDDWLILAGDLGETTDHLRYVLTLATERFARTFWVPGNHELWTSEDPAIGGVPKYERLLEVCRAFDVSTPEDEWPTIPDTELVLACLFLLYDYSFAPEDLDPSAAVAWAAASGILCADERRLKPDPYETREAWCRARLEATRKRLEALPAGTRTVLVNHWPLRLDLCRLFRIPRFTPWCGTRETEDWHVRYGADVVVSGHLHMRATDYRDGVRFEEVSLGYPRQNDSTKGAGHYLRQIWPATTPAPGADAGPFWHR